MSYSNIIKKMKTAEGVPSPIYIQPTKDDGLSPSMKAKNEGNGYIRKKEYQQAIDKYSEAILLCPADNKEDLAIFYQKRAAAYEYLIQGFNPEYYDLILDQIIGDCSKAFALNSRYMKALRRRSMAFEKKGKLREASIDFYAVCLLEQFKNETNIKECHRLLMKLYKMKAAEFFAKKSETIPSAQFTKQYFLSFTQDPFFPMIDGKSQVVTYDKLQQKAAELISRSHNNRAGCDPNLLLLEGTINVLKGKSYVATGKFLKVVQSTVQSSLLDEESLKKLKSNAWIKLANLQVNEISANVISPLNPHRPMFAASTIPEHRRQALDNFEKAAKIDPDNPDIYIHRARLYMVLNRIEDAVLDLEKCISLNPSFSLAMAQKLYVQHHKALTQGFPNRQRKALRDFQEAIEKFPDSPEFLNFYGQALQEADKFEDADQQFLKATQCDPGNAVYFVHRANLKLSVGHDQRGATKLLEGALRVDPSCYFALEMLGDLEVGLGVNTLHRGHLNNGLAQLHRALEYCTTEHDCTYVLALHYGSEVQFWANKLLGIPPLSTSEHLLRTHSRRSCAFCRVLFTN